MVLSTFPPSPGNWPSSTVRVPEDEEAEEEDDKAVELEVDDAEEELVMDVDSELAELKEEVEELEVARVVEPLTVDDVVLLLVPER